MTWLAALTRLPCALCLAPAGERGICDACHGDLPWIRHACPRCAEPLTGAAAACGQCLQSPPVFDAAIAPLAYAAPLDHMITDLKFHNAVGMASLLGRLLADAVPADLQPHRCLPMPLHPRRLRDRGYNQAALIAGRVARSRGWRLDSASAHRLRDTATQADLPATRRRANVRNAFAIHQPLTGEHVVILDDVVTTGATANALARACKRAGATRITLLAVARTP